MADQPIKWSEVGFPVRRESWSTPGRNVALHLGKNVTIVKRKAIFLICVAVGNVARAMARDLSLKIPVVKTIMS